MFHDTKSASSGGRRGRLGLSLLIAALALSVLPGAADAKKKDKVGVATFNLYLGSDLGPATQAILGSRTDLFADRVGEVFRDFNANDFNIRANNIAKQITKKKVDLVGLQEVALWRLQTPTDGSGFNAAARRATTPVIDYLDTLLEELNEKAKTKKECKQERQDANKTPGEKDDNKAAKCYMGYKAVVVQQEADLEFLGDLDNNAGPNGKTYDVSGTSTVACPEAPAPAAALRPFCWPQGIDDTGVNLAEPPAAQCSDGRDNDGDGFIDYGPTPGGGPVNPGDNEESGPAAGDATPLTGIMGTAAPYDCEARVDNSETDVNPAGADPTSLPQDANFDHGAFAGNHPPPAGASPQNGTPFCPAFPTPCPDSSPASPISYDSVAMGLDAGGVGPPGGPQVEDCAPAVGDESPDAGPADATPGWPFSGAGYAGSLVPVCMFHGIDGDVSLTMRDVILARVGNGVKTSNPRSNNFSNQFALTIPATGASIKFTRGWTALDAKVRGKKFTFVNTHLESENNGTVREDQAAELVAPGGPATTPNTVLVGDLNSDPNRAPVNLPDNDGGSNIAINRILAAGYSSLVTTPGIATGSHGDHGDVINDASDLVGEGWIDHILTNGLKGKGKPKLLDKFEDGLWSSDHAGVYMGIQGKNK